MRRVHYSLGCHAAALGEATKKKHKEGKELKEAKEAKEVKEVKEVKDFEPLEKVRSYQVVVCCALMR